MHQNKMIEKQRHKSHVFTKLNEWIDSIECAPTVTATTTTETLKWHYFVVIMTAHVGETLL